MQTVIERNAHCMIVKYFCIPGIGSALGDIAEMLLNVENNAYDQ